MQTLYALILAAALFLPFQLSDWISNYFLTKSESAPTPSPTVLSAQTKMQSPSPKPQKKALIKKTTTNSPFNTEEVLQALNTYRVSKGIGSLIIDPKLQTYAQTRVNSLKTNGKMDNHAGFNAFIANGDGFNSLGFNSLAENQSWNYKGDPSGLISEFYAKSPGHNANQLNPIYTHVGIGINAEYTNIIFGGSKK